MMLPAQVTFRFVDVVRGIGDKYEVMAANPAQSMKISARGYFYVIKKSGYGAPPPPKFFLAYLLHIVLQNS